MYKYLCLLISFLCLSPSTIAYDIDLTVSTPEKGSEPELSSSQKATPPVFTYTPSPNLKGKHIGIFANVYPMVTKYDETLEILKFIVDTVQIETTCRTLKATQSTTQPGHFMLYEEWEDYDELFKVQFRRPYRKGFSERLDSVRKESSSVELYEILIEYDKPKTLKKPKPVTPFSVVTRFSVAEGNVQQAKTELFRLLESAKTSDSAVLLRAHQRIGNPKQFMLYEEWLELENFKQVELVGETRQQFNNTIAMLSGNAPTQEYFDIRYDPVRLNN